MTAMHTAITSYNPLPDFFSSDHCKEDIRKLFEKSERTLEKEGVLEQLIQLEDWIDNYARNHSDAHKVANDGLECLHYMRKRLSERADDLMRLEGEGGLPATAAQELEIAELARAVKRIDHMIGLMGGKLS